MDDDAHGARLRAQFATTPDDEHGNDDVVP
jgi:hypothetical protein